MANLIILNGRIGDVPELTYTPEGRAKATWGLATNDTWRDKESGEKRTKTQWHRCVAWGKKAEAYASHMKKGKEYYVEGKMEYSQYEVDGQRHYSAQVNVDKVEF